jgi:Ca2+-transporting ATPase
MYYANYLGIDQKIVNNLTFYTLVLTQLVHVFNLPQRNQSFFINQVTTNKYIWMAILLCLVITVFAYYQPTLRQVLSLQNISLNEFLLIFPFSLLPVVLIQFLKRIRIVV